MPTTPTSTPQTPGNRSRSSSRKPKLASTGELVEVSSKNGMKMKGIVEKVDGRRTAAYLIRFDILPDPKWIDLENVPYRRLGRWSTERDSSLSRPSQPSQPPPPSVEGQKVTAEPSSPPSMVISFQLVVKILLLSFVIATLGTAYIIDEESCLALVAVSVSMYFVGRL